MKSGILSCIDKSNAVILVSVIKPEKIRVTHPMRGRDQQRSVVDDIEVASTAVCRTIVMHQTEIGSGLYQCVV